MNKYIPNIKDLVVQTIANGSEIKNRANSGDPIGCFKMGMIYLLGINTPIDFKKASKFFSNQSLSENYDVNRLLGFISECEGLFSQAFHYYAKTVSSENDSYLDKAIKGRNGLQDYLKKLGLPTSLNNEVSSIIGDYSKGNDSKKDAIIKIAAICNDEPTCLEAARSLYESKEYMLAIQWLKRGNIASENPMYEAINEKYKQSTVDLLNSKVLQIINLKSNSLLTNADPTHFFNVVKKTCEEASMKCSIKWKEQSNSYVDRIIKNQKDLEYQAYLASLAEEAEAKKKKNRMYKIIGVAAFFLLGIFVALIPSSDKESNKEDKVVEVKTILNGNGGYDSNTNDQVESQEDIKQEETPTMDDNGTIDNGSINFLSERRLIEDDLEGKSKKELEIMRNSIYARYGYKFKREDLLDYFSQYSWYNPTTSDMGSIYNQMSDNEKYNIDFIKRHE